MEDNLLVKIRESTDILELVREYVPNLKKSGRVYFARCPFHQEKTPSFSVTPDKGLFYCFGCHAGGDVFKFLMKIENLTFTEAAKKLAARANIEWHQSAALNAQDKARLRLYKIMEFAKNFYRKQLLGPQGQTARLYVKQRNLTEDTTEKFQLGLAFTDGLTRAALQKGITLQELRSLGLCPQSVTADYFRNRLMFPIFNHRGETVAFGGRIMSEDKNQPKYLNSPQTDLFSKSRVLYALNFAANAIRKENCAILLEGYMDVIAAHQAGAENCVAPMGTAFTAEHAKLLKRYANQAVLTFDPDAAGQSAALKASVILIENGIYVKVLTLPDGLDPDEYITKYGVESFKSLAQNALDIITFHLNSLLKDKTLTPPQKAQTATAIADIICRQPDEIIRHEWAKTAAERLGIGGQLMINQVNKALRAAQKQNAYYQEHNYREQDPPSAAPAAQNEEEQSNIPALPFEEDLISTLLAYPQYCGLCSDIEKKDIENPQIWAILEGVRALNAEQEKPSNAAIILAGKMPREQVLISKLAQAVKPQDVKPSKDIENYVKRIKLNTLGKELKLLKKEIKNYPAGQVPAQKLQEQIDISKKIEALRKSE